MTDASKIIQSIFYVSPYADLPPGLNTAGLTVQADSSQAPPTITNPVLVIRLRSTASPIVIGQSATSGMGTSAGSAFYQPPFPLSATEPYMVDVMWVEDKTPPNGIDWNDALVSAPVTAASVSIVSATFDGTDVTAKVSYGASGIGVGMQVSAYGLSGGVWAQSGAGQSDGDTVTFAATAFPAPFRIYAEALIPANNPGGQGTFAAPFSAGPFSSFKLMPQAISAVTSAAYDGENLSLAWSLAKVDGAATPQSSLIEVLVGGNVVTNLTGGAQSAIFPVKLEGQSAVSLRVSTTAENIGSVPAAADLLVEAPTVTNVGADISTSKVTANVTGSNGADLQAWLMNEGTVLAGPTSVSGGSVSFDYDASGRVGLGVVAQAMAANGTITGPKSNPAPLLATAPVFTGINLYTDPDDATQWRIDAMWQRLPDAPSDVQFYSFSVLQNGAVVLGGTATLSNVAATVKFKKSDITSGQPHRIELYATGTTGARSPALSLPVIFVSPTLMTVTTSQDRISATWAPVAGVPTADQNRITYQMVIQDGTGKQLVSGPLVAGEAGALPIADIQLPANGIPTILVNVIMGPFKLIADASMGTSCSAVGLMAVPTLHSVTTDPITGIATLNWQSAGDGYSYVIHFNDGTSQISTINSYAMPAKTNDLDALSYEVAVQHKVNNVVITGPMSAGTEIPADTANVTALRFNGATVALQWNAVANARAYAVTVYDDATPDTPAHAVTVTQTSTFFAFTATTSKTYTAYVQPALETGVGLAGNSRAVFATAYYPGQQPASSAEPYIYPATAMTTLGSATKGPTAEAFTVYLPELGAAAGALGNDPITSAPFTIQPSGNTTLPYQLMIAADDTAWKFDTTSIRTALQTAYQTFLTTVETPGNSLAGATAYGISVLQAAIARILPQTFEELLYYNFGMSMAASAGSNYVDLRPGMVLRAVICDYVNITQYQLPTWVNGYAGATVFDFDIGSYTNNGFWRTGFDGFLSRLAANGALNVPTPYHNATTGQSGGAAAVDLYYTQFQQPFYRLFIPASIPSPSDTGDNDTTKNFVLAAAADYAALVASNPDCSKNATAYFRGRTILEVLIKVSVNGMERLVPVGTSVGNLLEQLSLRPVSNSPVLADIRLYRSTLPVMTSTDVSTSIDPALEVYFDWNGFTTYAEGEGYDVLGMPLLSGDHLVTDAKGV